MKMTRATRWFGAALATVGTCAAALALAALSLRVEAAVAAQARRPSVERLRLYLFDLGFVALPSARNLFVEPLDVNKDGCCSVIAHLIVHPRGTLMWDAGVVPDAALGSPGRGGARGGQPLRAQMAAINYRPEDVTYFALSHYHYDHTANANDFRSSTWIVQQAERDAMFSEKKLPGVGPEPASQYSALKTSKTIALVNIDEYDVFGDGTVIVMAAPGHTPGHQVLVLNLPKTGRVMLAGDLYHFQEERAAQLVPTIEFDKAQTAESRKRIEEYVKRTKTALWIEHDARLYSTLKKAPNYLE